MGNCTTGLGSPALLYTSPRHMFHGRWSMLLYSLAMNLLEQYKEPDATVYLSASASQKTLPVSAGRAKATTPVMEEGREEETPGAGTRQLMGQRTA